MKKRESGKKRDMVRRSFFVDEKSKSQEDDEIAAICGGSGSHGVGSRGESCEALGTASSWG